jgi:NADP-dependent 3-hydroxy acid dehydrogenase YdfG
MASQSRTVFVTGASAGFGEAIVRRFATEGARMVASARRSGRIEALAKELGSGVLPLTLDVRDRAAVAAAVAALPPEAVHWAASLPPHVNINVIEMMPVAQSFGPLPVARQGG